MYREALKSVSVGLVFLLAAGSALCIQAGGKVIAESPLEENEWAAQHLKMVDTLKTFYGIKDASVLKAMAKVRRHVFIPEDRLKGADPYGDHPCSIGHGQTISQPFIVAYMTAQMKIKSDEKVLEIGTGSGYQAAILVEMGAKVYSVEIVPALAIHARKVLKQEGYDKVKVRLGDGYKGWSEHAPYDVVIVTCAPERIPQALVDQLAEGGRMIIPVGSTGAQRLVILRKKDGKTVLQNDLAVRFVPMVHGE